MTVKNLSALGLLTLFLGCGNPGSPSNLGDSQLERTGLEGVARRGPIQPICRVDQSCDAPFSARFEVRQGERLVATFQSDSAGRFRTYLTPGTYLVAPDASAPVLSPLSQTRSVTVGAHGLTHVELDFDTGIR
jgi:hypothetical protein